MTNNKTTPSFRLARIDGTHMKKGDDLVGMLTGRLATHEEYYPGIDSWIRTKVVPGLRTGERVGYVGMENERPILAAVLKRGEHAKFCHLSVEHGFRSNKYGSLLFSLMAAEVRHVASDIHFTLPESLWEQERAFFESFGFVTCEVARQQYRMFEEELSCSAPFERVWNKVREGLPRLLTSASISGYGFNDGVVISIREPYARDVMEGRKTVEVRRRFSERWSGYKASVYAAGEARALLGEVTIEDVIRGRPVELWEGFHAEMGCSFDDFANYVGDQKEVFLLKLAQPRPYAAPLSLSQLSGLIADNLTPPQSYCTAAGSKAWASALTAAALLHGDWNGLGRGTGQELMFASSEPESSHILPSEAVQIALDL